jgi:hypothetical protein
MRPGLPEKATHDYVRHGTPTLFAALKLAAGNDRCVLPATPHEEFLRTRAESRLPLQHAPSRPEGPVPGYDCCGTQRPGRAPTLRGVEDRRSEPKNRR